MCDALNHTHAKIEEWVTPINSRFLSSKMVHLFPGDMVHEHDTGNEREEVIVVLYGEITVTLKKSKRKYVSGETVFVGANTIHAVENTGDAPAQYCYVAVKRKQVDHAT